MQTPTEITTPTFVPPTGPDVPDVVKLPNNHPIQAWFGGNGDAVMEIPFKVLLFIVMRAIEPADDARELRIADFNAKLEAVMAFAADVMSAGFRPRRLPTRGQPEVFASQVAMQLEAFMRNRQSAITILKRAQTDPLPPPGGAAPDYGSGILWKVSLEDLSDQALGRLVGFAEIMALLPSLLRQDQSAGPLSMMIDTVLTCYNYHIPSMTDDHKPVCFAQAFTAIIPPPMIKRTVPLPRTPGVVGKTIQDWADLYGGTTEAKKRAFQTNLDTQMYDYLGRVVQEQGGRGISDIVALCQGLIGAHITDLSEPVLQSPEAKLDPLKHLLVPDLLQMPVEQRVRQIVGTKEATSELKETTRDELMRDAVMSAAPPTGSSGGGTSSRCAAFAPENATVLHRVHVSDRFQTVAHRIVNAMDDASRWELAATSKRWTTKGASRALTGLKLCTASFGDDRRRADRKRSRMPSPDLGRAASGRRITLDGSSRLDEAGVPLPNAVDFVVHEGLLRLLQGQLEPADFVKSACLGAHR